MEKTILYQAVYCPMTEESDYGTISIHFSYEGAVKALKAHKKERLRKFNEHKKWEKENNCYFPSKFGKWESWDIVEVEVLP